MFYGVLLKSTIQITFFFLRQKCRNRTLKLICRKLGFNESVIVDLKGKAEGHVLTWNENLSMNLLWNSDRVICSRSMIS